MGSGEVFDIECPKMTMMDLASIKKRLMARASCSIEINGGDR